MPTEAKKEVDQFMQGLIKRNPGEEEFHQAVREVAQTLMPFILENPKYKKAQILERLTEPDRIIIKEMARYARGRDPGEVPGILRRRFQQLGAPADMLTYKAHELDAVREAVEWSREGDVLVLLIHEDVDAVSEYLSNCSR